MTKLSLSICAALSLMSTGCSSPAPKQSTPLSTSQVEPCPLVACRLPGRPAILRNDQWEPALLEVEDELKRCAAQVLACRRQQAAGASGTAEKKAPGPSGESF